MLARVLLVAALLFGGLATGCTPESGCLGAPAHPVSGVRFAGLVSAEDQQKPPKPKPTTEPRKKSSCTKFNSPQWKSFKPFRGEIKTNGESGSKRRYYTWDHTHNDIEVWDGKGNHLGSADPATGEVTKPPVSGRNIKEKIK